jgi:hypothetical protein
MLLAAIIFVLTLAVVLVLVVAAPLIALRLQVAKAKLYQTRRTPHPRHS